MGESEGWRRNGAPRPLLGYGAPERPRGPAAGRALQKVIPDSCSKGEHCNPTLCYTTSQLLSELLKKATWQPYTQVSLQLWSPGAIMVDGLDKSTYWASWIFWLARPGNLPKQLHGAPLGQLQRLLMPGQAPTSDLSCAEQDTLTRTFGSS